MHASSICIATILLLAGLPCSVRAAVEPTAQATSEFDRYAAGIEARLDRQHQLNDGFVALAGQAAETRARLRGGETIVEKLTPSSAPEMPGAMLHHWRATVFVPGLKGAGLEHLLRDFAGYPRVFAPQVLGARVISSQTDRVQAEMRVKQKHILTVVMDADYDVAFGRLDAQHGYSISRSTRITEIGSPGTGQEHSLSGAEEHGFLWRLNTYWSWEERDGGLYMQIESISLTRSIPRGLGWAVGPFVESVPRESLEFTLRSVENALRTAPAADAAAANARSGRS